MDNVKELKPDNVLHMRAQHPIFTQELKDKMVTTLGTEDAKQTVDNMEHVICSHIVLKLRLFGEKIGKAIGEKFAKVVGLKDE
jgi:hypothetical protein